MIKANTAWLKRNENGFTLIESMMSLAIISVGMIGIIPMFEMSFMSNASGRNTTIANRLMARHIEMVRAISFDNVSTLILNDENYSEKSLKTETITIESVNYNSTSIVATYNESGNTLNSNSFQLELARVNGYPFSGLNKISATITWSDPLFEDGDHSVSGTTYLESL